MRTRVFGPAYLDRVLRVDGPLGDQAVDQSVEGELEPGPGLALADAAGAIVRIDPPEGWPGPFGVIRLARPVLGGGSSGLRRNLRAVTWQDDLGGMGAGYASAFGAVLTSALGSVEDPTSRAVSALLERAGIAHQPVRVANRPADWTLLVTSGEHGDKLPIGFRGCHEAVEAIPPGPPCDLRVVAGLPNRLAGPLLRADGAGVRFFAPAMRNMLDRAWPLASFAASVDVLCCNRREWETLPEKERIAVSVGLLAITDGPRGSEVRFRRSGSEGGWEVVRISAFPRARPPRDTNRAGEAYAATLIGTLRETGWAPDRPDSLDTERVRSAALRASAAAALVLDRVDFGFPDRDEVDRALLAGRVA